MKVPITTTCGRVLQVEDTEVEAAHRFLHREPRPPAPYHFANPRVQPSSDALQLAEPGDLPFAEKERRVREAVSRKWPPAISRDGSLNVESLVNVEAVYETYAILSRGGRTYRVGYSFDGDLNVQLDADDLTSEVIPTYETLSASERPAVRRWLSGIERIKREQGVDDRKAGEILSLRDPHAWTAYREAFADGERLPRVDPRRNRHLFPE